METIISLKNSHVSPETRSPEDQRRTLNYFLPLRPEPGDPTYRNRDGRRILKRDKIKLLVFHIVYFFWVVSGEERR